jgi:hypothetical protein
MRMHVHVRVYLHPHAHERTLFAEEERVVVVGGVDRAQARTSYCCALGACRKGTGSVRV